MNRKLTLRKPRIRINLTHKLIVLILITSSLTPFWIASGQITGVNRKDFRLHVAPVKEKMIIDGLLNEQVWKTAEKTGLFYRILPIDTGFAKAQTRVMVGYDQSNLYFAIICFDPTPGKRPVESLRRDFSFPKNDNFIIFMDTYNDKTNGFSFGVSAAGAQWDGLQANGGFVSLDWDCKWKSAVKNYPNRWVAEFSIPFRSIRYEENAGEWGINFSRLDLKTNEKSSWAPVPRQFQSANLAYTGALVWDEPPPGAGVNYSLIPYISGKAVRDVEAGESTNTGLDAGMDAKITLSTSMNLDLTVHPDYSQVEVDQQVTNLDRYELFFPEKRQFFLENSDLFASLGSDRMRPFFSRRIGLNTPVLAGGRLSGKLGNNYRIGLMDMQTNALDTIPAANYGVAVVQRQLFSRSNVTLFLVNKQITGVSEDSLLSANIFNRVAGVDFNLANANNRWTGKAFYHQSFYPDAPKDAFVVAGNLAYNTQKLSVKINQAWVGEHFQAETGYIPRKGFFQVNPELQYKFFPASKKLANHGPLVKTNLFFGKEMQLTDREVSAGYALEWLNRSKLSGNVKDVFVRLQEPFDPTHTGGDSLAAGSTFDWKEMEISYNSDTRKLFNYELMMNIGGYYNGTKRGVTGVMNFRVQPYGSLAMVASYYRIILPEPYNSADLILVGPRLDLTFTDKLFLTTFVQYNNQIENLNLNIRFQWRFAPVSEFYIVYTENSYPENLQTKNRALVAKLSYWFN